MQNYRKLIVLVVTVISLLGGLVMVSQSSQSTQTVFADGSGSPTSCTENENPSGSMDGSVEGTENVVSASAPSGKIITGVCIKSGNNMFAPNKHSGVLTNGTYENNCYTVSGVGTNQVKVERTGTASNTCQGISHIDVIFGNNTIPTPTPTPTDTPTPTVTPTPTDTPTPTVTPTPTDTPTPTVTITVTPTPTCTGNICVILDCPGQGDCEVQIGKTPTPTATPSATPSATVTATPSATPTNTPNNGGSNNIGGDNPSNNQGNVQGVSTQTSKGQVLGASTLAATGTFSIAPFGVLLGALLTSASVIKRVKLA